MGSHDGFVSKKFVATVDKYHGMVTRCEQAVAGGPYSLTVESDLKDVPVGPWQFEGQPGPWATCDRAVVSVTTNADGKLAYAVESVP